MPQGKRPADVVGNAVHVMRIVTCEISENGDKSTADHFAQQTDALPCIPVVSA